MKQITITVPDNFELKQDGNTYTIIKKEKEKEKKLTYEDVVRQLFYGKSGFFINDSGKVQSNLIFYSNTFANSNNCISKKQAKKLLAINKLMNVAKYLNGDWQPDWKNRNEDKVFIYIDYIDKSMKFGRSGIHQSSEVYFKSEELAQQAIEIIGEETIKLALCTDY